MSIGDILLQKVTYFNVSEDVESVKLANISAEKKKRFKDDFKVLMAKQSPQYYSGFGITSCYHCGAITSIDNEYCKCGEPATKVKSIAA